MNFQTFRSVFPDLIEAVRDLKGTGCITGTKNLRIVVVRGSSGKPQFIESLTGFSIKTERDVPNPIEYHFTYDPTCGENEAFCRVKDVPIEFNICLQYDELADEINEHIDWGSVYNCDSIVLTIRSSSVADLKIVDFPLSTMSPEYGPIGQRNERIFYIQVCRDKCTEYTEKFDRFDRLELIELPNDHPCERTVSAIRSVLIGWEDPDIIRDKMKKRLRSLGYEVPKNEAQQKQFLSLLLTSYKCHVEYVLEPFIVSLTFCGGAQHSVVVENSLEYIGSQCVDVLQDYFDQFPYMFADMERVIMEAVNSCAEPELDKVARYLTRDHFVLFHAIVCKGKPCIGDCDYIVLVQAFCSPIVERTISTVVKQLDVLFSNIVPLLPEPTAIVEERRDLKKKLKIMHRAFFSH